MSQLTEKDLIVGEKYVPISKSVGCSLENSTCWERAKDTIQFYLFYKGVRSSSGLGTTEYIFTDNMNGGGDFFLLSDMVPYVEEHSKKPVESYDVFGADGEIGRNAREKFKCPQCNVDSVVLEDITNAGHPSVSYNYICLSCDATFNYP